MYGLIGRFSATPGDRDRLAEILHEGTRDLPGCVSYVIAHDEEDPDALWITEVWVDAEHHQASLRLESVQAAIGLGRPLIAGMDRVATTRPLGD